MRFYKEVQVYLMPRSALYAEWKQMYPSKPKHNNHPVFIQLFDKCNFIENKDVPF